MGVGSDVGGRITRLAGGVVMNIAMTLRGYGLTPTLLTVIGKDEAGAELVSTAEDMGLDMAHVLRRADLSTDQYMAIEDANGVVAAIADAHSLEAAGDAILKPLSDGSLGSADTPYDGMIALDGNLTEDLLTQIATMPEFSKASLKIAPASPGKVGRLAPLLAHPNATLYVNREEAGTLCNTQFDNAEIAATQMVNNGAARVAVTDGSSLACFASPKVTICQAPRSVQAKRITGAGDTFMAAHMVAEMRGQTPEAAMQFALDAAATYVSGE